jgi:hypothetical protein
VHDNPKGKFRLEQRGRDTESHSNGENEKPRNGDTHETQESQEVASFSVRFNTLQEAARVALSTKSRDPVFTYARAVKAFEKTIGRQIPQKEMAATFNTWWHIAKPTLPADADREEYFFLFGDAYERARVPLGQNVIQEATRRIDLTEPPPEAARYESPKIKRLIHLCHELQLMAGDSFFLSVRDASRVINCKNLGAVSAFLHGLCRDGVLEEISPGSAGGRRAARFCFMKEMRDGAAENNKPEEYLVS